MMDVPFIAALCVLKLKVVDTTQSRAFFAVGPS